MARGERAYYRNAKGEVECPMITHPGSNCGHECGPECPVMITMLAARDIEENNLGRAERALTDVLRKVPDYTIASEALGTLYRRQHKYSKAQDVYYKAYQLNGNNKDVLFGLILSYIAQGDYDGCQKYLDEYIQKYGRDKNLQALGEHLLASVTKGVSTVKTDQPMSMAETAATQSTVQGAAVQILAKLIHYAALNAVLPYETMSTVPEIWERADDTVNALYQGILNLYQKDLDSLSIHTILFGFSVYAGMGAVALWNADWPSLKKEGIYNSLIKERALYSMDEYVSELVGYPYASEQGKRLMHDLQGMIPVALKASDYKLTEEKPQNSPDLHECMKALFYFGTVRELQELGRDKILHPYESNKLNPAYESEWLDDDDLVFDLAASKKVAGKISKVYEKTMPPYEYDGIKIDRTVYTKENNEKEQEVRRVERPQRTDTTRSAITRTDQHIEYRDSVDIKKEALKENQRREEPKRSGRFVGYACGVIVAVVAFAATTLFIAYASGFVMGLSRNSFNYNADVTGVYLWLYCVELFIGLPCHIGAAWLTTQLMYRIPLGYRGEQKYYVTAAEAIIFFAILTFLGGGICEGLMRLVHAYYIRKFGASLSWISEEDTTKEERERKPRSYNQKAYLIGLLVMAAVIVAIIGYNAIATRNKDQINSAGESSTSVFTESQMESIEDTAAESQQEDGGSEKVYESAAEQEWYDNGYGDGYSAGKEAWNTGTSTYDSSGSGAEKGSREEELYKEGYSDGYKLGITEDRDAALK